MRSILLFLSVVAAGMHLEAYPLVYLEEETIDLTEGTDATLTAILSEVSYIDVEVPFYIDPSSTATIKSEYDEDENDYFIVESDDEDIGYTFDPDTGYGKLIITRGTTQRSLSIDIDNDLDEEDDETLIFTVIPEDVTVARPVAPLQKTIRILDNDAEDSEDSEDVRVEFTLEEATINEGNYLSIAIYVSSDVEEETMITYSTEFDTATEADFDLEESDDLSGSFIHEGGGGREYLYFKILEDLDVEDYEEVFYVNLISATGTESNGSYPIGLERIMVTIEDNDPTVLSLTLEEDDDGNKETSTELEEGSYYTLYVSLIGGDPDDPGEGGFDEDLEIPVYFGGTAIYGDEDDDLNESDFYTTSDVPLEIEAGESSASLTVFIWNDDLIEDTETLIIGLGTATLVDSGTTVPVEWPESFTIEIEDNDPSELNFVRLNPDYDADDEDSEETYYMPGTQQIVGEAYGTVTIPIYLSAPIAYDLTFDVTLDMEQTTATLYDPDLDEDEQEDWDFSISASTATWEPEALTHELTIYAGQQSTQLYLFLNDDEETSFVLGDPVPDDVESDEEIHFSISNLDSDSETLVFGEATDFTVLVKELPEIEVTPLFSELNADESNWIDGQPVYNELTGLFELDFNFTPPEGFDADLTGYNSYKLVIDLSHYDPDNPDSAENDALTMNPYEPDDNEAFEYYVDFPFQLRYPNGTDYEVLIEGAEQTNEKLFDEENANTVRYLNYLLRPLSFPLLEPEYEEEIEQTLYDATDPFAWRLQFRNRGIRPFPVERLDLDQFPENVRIFLTPESASIVPTQTSTYVPVLRLEEQDDSSILLEIDTSSTSQIQVQYIGEDGIWRIAQPSIINTSGSRLHWIDQGPPSTVEHPSKVKFRIYQVISSY